MAWPRFTVAFEQIGSDHWSRVGEMETVGNTLGSTLGTSVDRSPPSPSPILSYLLHLPTFYTQGAQDPGCWVQEWPCPLPELLCPCSSSICSVCTGLQPLYQVRERLYLLEFNKVCPWPPRFYWRPSSLKGRWQRASASTPLAINQGVSVTNLQRTGGQYIRFLQIQLEGQENKLREKPRLGFLSPQHQTTVSKYIRFGFYCRAHTY